MVKSGAGDILGSSRPDALDTVGVELEGGGHQESSSTIAENYSKSAKQGGVGEVGHVGVVDQGDG